jgi:hypothetical protein
MNRKPEEKNKKTIIIISVVVVLILLISGIFLIGNVFSSKNKGDKSKYMVLGSGEHNTFSVKSGTEDFEIRVAFAPNNTQVWAMNNEGCKYSINIINQANYCINKGWSSVREDVLTGTSIAPFDIVEDGIGYASIKINVPKNVPSCIQRFIVEVKCNLYGSENIQDYFNVEVI